MSRKDSDYDYIIRIIQHLQNHLNIRFFITVKDFDALYNWWEKNIPLQVVFQSMANVIERWQLKNKPIKSFQNFSYEIRKNLQSYLSLHVGCHSDVYVTSDVNTVEQFMNCFPDELVLFKNDFQSVFQQYQQKKEIECSQLYTRLIENFKTDQEIILRVKIFLKNLSPELHKPQLIDKFILNYVKNKFRIPDFESIE
jgi:hypothetical protein